MADGLRLCPRGGLPTVSQAFTAAVFDVHCTCGFGVQQLSSMEAALDTVRWHFGEDTPSASQQTTTGGSMPTSEHEATLRVLYHVVSSYQAWRKHLPNELSDDAVRIGEQHLREQSWWPADRAGFLGTTAHGGRPESER